MGEELSLNHDSPAVQKHLEITQNVITRMAENSRSCKVWCVTLVSAVLVLVAQTEKPEYSLIALIPAVLFLILDTYYLTLERGFRESYNAFVRKLNGDDPMLADLYKVAPSGSVAGHFGASLKSFSIWTFYVTLVVMVLVVWVILR
ncbi:MAG: hypothetical protein OXD46_05330 [Chloroflexi bacterium]|nr:hypothetical protein [Chloroflexota bacterium]